MTDKKHRPVDEIRNDYGALVGQAGNLQYQIYALGKDLDIILNQMRDLNLEAAASNAASKEQPKEEPKGE